MALSVSVWDHVLSPSACCYLHATSSVGNLGDECHTAFDRSLPPRTPLESALHSILAELGDTSPCVEYWWRDEWQHVEAHCDVDEYLFERDGVWSYPINGHVLYLEVGRAVQGPTCVWSRGGTTRDDFGVLTTVPAKAGRLLRFDGDLMHAVPAPTDVWLDEDHWFEGVESDTPEDRIRSVVLFNTWKTPPLDVDSAPSTNPIQRVKLLADEFGGDAIDVLLASMETPDDTCLPFANWLPVHPFVQESSAVEDNSRGPPRYFVSLLGESQRRRQEEEEVELLAPAGLIEALTADSVVTRLPACAHDAACASTDHDGKF